MLRCPLTAVFLSGLIALTPPVQAGQACSERDSIIKGLGTDYGETQQAAGLQSETQMVEIWLSKSTGSFTILLSTPDGQSCIISSGANWTSYEQRPLHVGTPS